MADPCVPGLCLPSIFFVAAGQAGRCSPRHVLFHCSEVFNATPLTEFIKREDRRDAELKRRANKPPLDTERAAHALADDTCAESRRLADSEARVADWKKWGCVLGSDVAELWAVCTVAQGRIASLTPTRRPFVSERAWGTVREDYRCALAGVEGALVPALVRAPLTRIADTANRETRGIRFRMTIPAAARTVGTKTAWLVCVTAIRTLSCRSACGTRTIPSSRCSHAAPARGCSAVHSSRMPKQRSQERLFGLTGSEGNHGEDVKEYYWCVPSACLRCCPLPVSAVCCAAGIWTPRRRTAT